MKRSLLLGIALTALANSPAFATTTTFSLTLNGANEAPANSSAGQGLGLVKFDDSAHTMKIDLVFIGLTGFTTAAHIHCCTATAGVATAGVATELPLFTGFPTGVTAGTYSHVFDLSQASSWNAAYISNNGGTTASAETAFLAGITAGKAYLNIHTTDKPAGEIRSFLTPTAVPVPAASWLMGSAMLGLIGFKRKSAV